MVQQLHEHIHSAFEGVVVRGNQIGRQIGFPTANIHIQSSIQFPTLNGVYSVKVFYNDESYDGVMNIGVKPTFEQASKEKSFEVHILAFDKDIYGETLHIEICAFIRSERKFKSVDALKKQLHEDCDVAKKQLASLGQYVVKQALNTDVVQIPDLSFVRYCEEHFRINRGVYNAIDEWFAERGERYVVERRTLILRFLHWVTVYVPQQEKLEFGNKGLSEQLQTYYDNYVA